ncbi:peptidase [Sphingobium sp. GW456-12-10-14-TSB1]|jgi:conjugal transfer pilin signal peptidase TrbI|uniref:S26 family signal peptidase n=1 Tax=Sphingobium TaxID=165695 RepID=UPI000A39E39A|nr:MULTISPECIES: S26 family signal peptidase [Sphingobium]MBS86721.1 peptidase [Sphingobium sp.]OUC52775.1 peptidase [Sphingobium sp. GW456-12-10-14-TSB1]|tara:strand:- start:6852 stop:7448 length:597 start_codon:yes stop_codon:yes gene_type:complete
MFRLAWNAARGIAPRLRALPKEAALALGAARSDEPGRTLQLAKACAIILPIAAVTAWGLPQLTLIMSPSIDAWLVRKAPGPIHRGDLVSFKLVHPLAGPAPVDVTKYALCFPGDRIEIVETPSMTPGAWDGRYYCNGHLLGISKAIGQDGQRLTHWKPTASRIAAGHIYVGSTHANGFDSRYYGPVAISRLIRMEKLL